MWERGQIWHLLFASPSPRLAKNCSQFQLGFCAHNRAQFETTFVDSLSCAEINLSISRPAQKYSQFQHVFCVAQAYPDVFSISAQVLCAKLSRFEADFVDVQAYPGLFSISRWFCVQNRANVRFINVRCICRFLGLPRYVLNFMFLSV